MGFRRLSWPRRDRKRRREEGGSLGLVMTGRGEEKREAL